jgi:hypothetical protein
MDSDAQVKPHLIQVGPAMIVAWGVKETRDSWLSTPIALDAPAVLAR